MTASNPIVSTIDLDADGVQHGHLQLPHSRDDSAWGSILIPITVIRNGSGPTALLTGANHGDEYEGPVALFDLAQTIQADQVTGTMIILPALNYPAFLAATRTSPIDGGNMNRIFPGRPNGTISEKIADYVQSELVTRADLVLDFHSGGKTLDFVPFAAVHVLDDQDQQAACNAALRAFNAPYSVMMREIDNVGMLDTAVETMGKVFVTTELGGGGSSSAYTNAIAKRGVRNLLIHAGILAGEIERQPTQHLSMPEGCFVFGKDAGLVEYLVDLGSVVEAGQVIARVWPTDRTGSRPTDYPAPFTGILAARHFPGLIGIGDCLAVVALAG